MSNEIDRLLAIYNQGIMFDISVYQGGDVSVWIKTQHGFPHSFKTLKEAVDWLWTESGLEDQS